MRRMRLDEAYFIDGALVATVVSYPPGYYRKA